MQIYQEESFESLCRMEKSVLSNIVVDNYLKIDI